MAYIEITEAMIQAAQEKIRNLVYQVTATTDDEMREVLKAAMAAAAIRSEPEPAVGPDRVRLWFRDTDGEDESATVPFGTDLTYREGDLAKVVKITVARYRA